MKYQTLIVVLLGLSLGTAGAWASDTNISGTWACTIEATGPPGIVTFVFKQEGEKLSGTYSGPLGEFPVTGAVKGDKVVFGYKATTNKGHAIKATYTGTIESPAKMTGAVEYSGGARGKWAAAKKK